MSGKHAPLPWSVEQEDSGGLAVLAADGLLAADCSIIFMGEGRSEEVCGANAELIVRAVNAHDDLFAACREAIEWTIHDPNCRSRRNEGCDCHMGRIEAAIAKAEGKSS